MKRYKRIVVPIALNEGDGQIVKWAAKISLLAQSEEVIFVHPMDIGDLPTKAKEKYPWLATPIGEQAIKEMKSRVEAEWEGDEITSVGYRAVDRSSQALAILEVVVETDCDLVIVQRENFGHDLAIRLARKAPCSVMVIPDKAPFKLDNILVPVDFSSHCERALDVATAFAKAGGIRAIESVHAFNIGRMSHRAAIPKEELIRDAKEFVQEEHNKFIDALDTKGVHVNRKQVCHLLTPQAISYEAEELGCDLIVVGCRGKDTITALLLGSNAEEIMRLSPVPVIAAKDKGTGIQLLKALLGE